MGVSAPTTATYTLSLLIVDIIILLTLTHYLDWAFICLNYDYERLQASAGDVSWDGQTAACSELH